MVLLECSPFDETIFQHVSFFLILCVYHHAHTVQIVLRSRLRFCVVSRLFNIIVDNYWLLWVTLLSPLFCGYLRTLGVFVLKGIWGGGCPQLSMTSCIFVLFFYLNG